MRNDNIVRRGWFLVICMLATSCLALANDGPNRVADESLWLSVVDLDNGIGYDPDVIIHPTMIMVHSNVCTDSDFSEGDIGCIVSQLAPLGYQYLVDPNGLIYSMAPMRNGSFVKVYHGGKGIQPGTIALNWTDFNAESIGVGLIVPQNGSVTSLQYNALARITAFAMQRENITTVAGQNATAGWRVNEVPITYSNATTIVNNNTAYLPYNPRGFDLGLAVEALNSLTGANWSVVETYSVYINPQMNDSQVWDSTHIDMVGSKAA